MLRWGSYLAKQPEGRQPLTPGQSQAVRLHGQGEAHRGPPPWCGFSARLFLPPHAALRQPSEAAPHSHGKTVLPGFTHPIRATADKPARYSA